MEKAIKIIGTILVFGLIIYFSLDIIGLIIGLAFGAIGFLIPLAIFAGIGYLVFIFVRAIIKT